MQPYVGSCSVSRAILGAMAIALPTARPERSAEGAKSKDDLANLQKTARDRLNVFAT